MNKNYLYSAVGILLLVVGIFVAFQNALIVTQVSIKLLPGIKEHRDHSLGKLAKENELPDYRVKLNIHRRLTNVDLGTRLNVSAAEWIDFPVSDRVYARRLQEIIIIEDDPIKNDILDRFPIAPGETKGSKYQSKVTAVRTWDAGLAWLVKEPSGLALLITALALTGAGPVAAARKKSHEKTIP